MERDSDPVRGEQDQHEECWATRPLGLALVKLREEMSKVKVRNRIGKTVSLWRKLQRAQVWEADLWAWAFGIEIDDLEKKKPTSEDEDGQGEVLRVNIRGLKDARRMFSTKARHISREAL